MSKPAIIALLLSTLCLSACACGESFPCNTGGDPVTAKSSAAAADMAGAMAAATERRSRLCSAG
jgi:hypothetical protein